MAEEFKISPDNYDQPGESMSNYINDGINAGKTMKVVVSEWKEGRKLSQNALLHVWVAQISKHLMTQGRAYCTPEWVKRQLKGSFLGTESIESVCLLTGGKSVTVEVRSSSKLDKGEFNFFLNRIQEWAVDIGLILSAPIDSQYMELNNRQVS